MAEFGVGIIAFALILVATWIGSIGALLFKIGSVKIRKNLVTIFIGLVCYGTSSLFFIAALRYGNVSVLYPMVALGYIWVSLLSMWKLGEKMGLYKWLGIAFIIFGVGLIGVAA